MEVRRGLVQSTGRDGTAFSAVGPSERPAGACEQSAQYENVQRPRWFRAVAAGADVTPPQAGSRSSEGHFIESGGIKVLPLEVAP